eukprot:701288-Ditylum_brightwellii.AAC.1
MSTLPLELRPATDRTKRTKVEDGAYVGSISDIARKQLSLPRWRQHTDTERILLQDLQESNISIDKVSQFSIQPTEFQYVFDKVENYNRWFETNKEVQSYNELISKLNIDFESSLWIDGIQHEVRFREKDLPEIMEYLEELNGLLPGHHDEVEARRKMVALFDRTKEELDAEEANVELSEAGELFDCVILNDAILMTEILPVQMTSLYVRIKDKTREAIKNTKQKILDAAFLECYKRSANQPEASFHKQKAAIKVCKEAIDQYLDVMDQTELARSVIIRGFPGAGKT